MTEYKENVWYRWDGGDKFPVHDNSIVQTFFFHGGDGEPRTQTAGSAIAGNQHWPNVIAFRVVKEYREPQEWWAVGKHLHDTEAEAQDFKASLVKQWGGSHAETPIIHVREVQP